MLSLAIVLAKLSCAASLSDATDATMLSKLNKDRHLYAVLTHMNKELRKPVIAGNIAPRNLNAIKSCFRFFCQKDFSVQDESCASALLQDVIWPLQMQIHETFGWK